MRQKLNETWHFEFLLCALIQISLEILFQFKSKNPNFCFIEENVFHQNNKSILGSF